MKFARPWFERLWVGATSLAVGAVSLSSVSCAIHHARASSITIHLVSSAFADGESIPGGYTCTGNNVSPPLRWSKPPQTARSIVLICNDPDAPNGDWVHWIIYNFPPNVASLPENIPPQVLLSSGAHQLKNDFERVGYGGPCPPAGPAHHYHFHIYALNNRLSLDDDKATKADVESAMDGHIVAQGELIGLYAQP